MAAATWRSGRLYPGASSSPTRGSSISCRGSSAFERLLASPLVRERATIGGNIANASPVGDLTAMLIALGALVRVQGAGGAREMPLERLFLGYKKIDLRPRGGAPGEIIAAVLLPASRPFALFNFEKVSKRERLDIAAVNSAASFEVEAAGRQHSDCAGADFRGRRRASATLPRESFRLPGRQDAPTRAPPSRRRASPRAKPRRSGTCAAAPITGAASSSASSSPTSCGSSRARASRRPYRMSRSRRPSST